jgi:hypothetical protein
VASAQIEFAQMQAISDIVAAHGPGAVMASQLQALDLDPMLFGTLLEVIGANPL